MKIQKISPKGPQILHTPSVISSFIKYPTASQIAQKTAQKFLCGQKKSSHMNTSSKHKIASSKILNLNKCSHKKKSLL